MRAIHRLSALQVGRIKEPGVYPDGNGLYLQVTEHGTKSWIHRYTLAGKARWMGLGSLEFVSLSEARTLTVANRKLLHEGIDPIDSRKAHKRVMVYQRAEDTTFATCATRYIEAHRSGWKNPKHVMQWGNTLVTYANPTIGKISVDQITVAMIEDILRPIWIKKPETADRVRGRIEKILGWAKVQGYRDGDNPAAWKENLDHILPRRNQRIIKHHKALPYSEVEVFWKGLDTKTGYGVEALRILVLTATRTREAIGAEWKEFDLKRKIWTIPAERMKTKKLHRIPLSIKTVELLQNMQRLHQAKFVFPGMKVGRHMTGEAMLKCLEGRPITLHGFRSTFRDWADEQTDYPRDIIESALAHDFKTDVEAAYRRGDQLEKRRPLMEDWARFVTG